MTTILLVEDDPQVQRMLQEFLEEEGYTVEVANNGDEGLELYRQSSPDLVVMDIIMPGKDGVETIHCLKRDFPDAKVIAISGGSANIPGDHLLETAERLGAARAYGKPLDFNVLAQAIKDVLAEG